MTAEITQVGDFLIVSKPDGDAWIAEICYPDNRIFAFDHAQARAFYTLRFPTSEAAIGEAKKIIASGKMK